MWKGPIQIAFVNRKIELPKRWHRRASNFDRVVQAVRREV